MVEFILETIKRDRLPLGVAGLELVAFAIIYWIYL